MLVLLISSAKNTRPEPAATATVATTDVFAGQSVHEHNFLFYQTGGNMTKGLVHVKLKFRRGFHFTQCVFDICHVTD
jgi:hypothetical protein